MQAHWRPIVVFLASMFLTVLVNADDKPATSPAFGYEVARMHELKPHRRTIPIKGIEPGFDQIHLRITVSPTGAVLDVHPSVEVDPPSYADRTLKFWPQLEGEVRHWKFAPFEQNGIPVTAEIEEYIDLVPPERLPKLHIVPPPLQPNSRVSILLDRSGCFGSCPSYTVTASTDGILFVGRSYVVAAGEHVAPVDPHKVWQLASRFVKADFYSMEPKYVASVTDNPAYVLSLDIDGHKKTVEDYVGSWEGMPLVITDLETEVDALAESERWIAGVDGLVQALQAERFNFQSFEGQAMLKEAANRGQSETVRELVAAGVPLDPLPVPGTKRRDVGPDFAAVGLLTSASSNLQSLQPLLDVGASRNDQSDKDLALAGAARAGNLESVRALIAYGANPNSDLKLTVTERSGGMTVQGPGPGSVLIDAAESGNPDVVKEILRYHPNLEARGYQAKTAMFAAGEYRNSDKEGARVECVRLLAEAGANVNARDKDGNTPLHEIFLTDVEEELLKLGADVNSLNKDGETPIFTNVDDDSISLLIEHGANLNIRNNKGETVVEAAKEHGPARMEALRKALQSLVQKQ
jgi:ankyrin repeat protein